MFLVIFIFHFFVLKKYIFIANDKFKRSQSQSQIDTLSARGLLQARVDVNNSSLEHDQYHKRLPNQKRTTDKQAKTIRLTFVLIAGSFYSLFFLNIPDFMILKTKKKNHNSS